MKKVKSYSEFINEAKTVYTTKSGNRLTIKDIYSDIDHHERTGFYPDFYTEKEWIYLTKKYGAGNMSPDIDPAGGSGLYSHI